MSYTSLEIENGTIGKLELRNKQALFFVRRFDFIYGSHFQSYSNGNNV